MFDSLRLIKPTVFSVTFLCFSVFCLRRFRPTVRTPAWVHMPLCSPLCELFFFGFCTICLCCIFVRALIFPYTFALVCRQFRRAALREWKNCELCLRWIFRVTKTGAVVWHVFYFIRSRSIMFWLVVIAVVSAVYSQTVSFYSPKFLGPFIEYVLWMGEGRLPEPTLLG